METVEAVDDEVKPAAVAAAEPEAVSLTDVPVLLFARGLALLLTLVSVVVGLHWYLGARLIRDAAVPAPYAQVLWTVLWGSFASIFAGFVGGRVLPRPLARVAQWVGFVWMGAFGLLLTGTAASDLVLWGAAQVTAVDGAWQEGRALAVAGLVVPALLYGGWVARRPVVKRLELKIPGLGQGLDGLKVVQLSDVHLGETLGRAFAEQVTAQVNALSPDVVVITGDLVDGSPKKLRDEVAPLSGLRAREGVFYVTGNHEYYHGAAAWEAEGRRLGMTVLHNEHRVVERGGARLVIAGVTDVEGARFSAAHAPRVDLAFAGAPAAPRLLLAHQPRFAKQAAEHRVSLMLSGHTHGGQIYPFNYLVRATFPWVKGLYREVVDGRDAHIYVNRGAGYWGPPMRLGSPPEISKLILTS